MTPKQMHAALKIIIKRGILVLDAMGDIDAKFRSAGIWGLTVDDAWHAYGQNRARVRLVPTARESAQAEIVGDWLLWLGRTQGGVELLVSWAHEHPIWRLAERPRVSETTIHNRIDRSVGAILREFNDFGERIPPSAEDAA